MKFSKFVLIAATSALLTACQTLEQTWDEIKSIDFGSSENSEGALKPMTNDERKQAELHSPCPNVKIVSELSSLSEFTTMSRPSADTLITRVDMGTAESTCDFQRGYVALDLKLQFEGQLGPKGRLRNNDKPYFSYPFFVAVTDANDNILAKEIFSAAMTYNREEKHHTYYESLKQLIPINRESQAREYTIMIGFQLSPDQLEYNRANLVSKSQ